MSSEWYKEEVARQLKEYGTKLLDPPNNVFQLSKILEKLEQVLAVVEQGPSDPVQSSLIPAMKGLIGDKVLQHRNVDIRVSVAYCFSEIMRITAPDSPYKDEEMKELFQLMVKALDSLTLLYSPNFIKTVSILESVAKFKSCVVMLDLEMDELVITMLTKFFQKIRSNHPDNLFIAMERITTIIIEESEDISVEFLNILLESMRKDSQYLSPLSWKLGEKVLCNCASKLKPYLIEAVKGMGNDMDSFSEIITHICISDAFEQTHYRSLQERTVSNFSQLYGMLQGDENKLDSTNQDEPFQDDENKLDRSERDHLSQGGKNKLERTDPNQPSEISSFDQLHRTLHDDVDKLGRTDPGQPSQVELAPADVFPRDAAQAVGDASKLQVTSTGVSLGDKNQEKNGTYPKGLDHCHTEHLQGTNALGNGKTNNLNLKLTVKSEPVPDNVSKKRDRKPNTLLRSEEGYDHSWIAGGRKDAKSPYGGRPSGKMSNNLESARSLTDAHSDIRQRKRGRPKKGDSMIGPDDHPICSSPKRENAFSIVSHRNPSSCGGKKKRSKKSRSENILADVITTSFSRQNVLDGRVKEETLEFGSGGKTKEIGSRSDFIAKPDGCTRNMDVHQNEHKPALTQQYASMTGEEKPKKKRRNIRSYNDHKETSRIKKVIWDAMASPKTGLKRKRSVSKDKVPKMCDLDGRLVGKKIKVWWPMDAMYYEGVIDSFDPIQKKHKVFYTDGDIENLDLYEERWECIPDDESQDKPEADIQIIGASSARIRNKKRKSKLAKDVSSSSSRLKSSVKGVEASKSGETVPLVAKPDRPRVYDLDTETSSDTNIKDYVVKPTGNSKMRLLNSFQQSSSETETESETGSPKGALKSCSAGRSKADALFTRDQE